MAQGPQQQQQQQRNNLMGIIPHWDQFVGGREVDALATLANAKDDTKKEELYDNSRKLGGFLFGARYAVTSFTSKNVGAAHTFLMKNYDVYVKIHNFLLTKYDCYVMFSHYNFPKK